MSSLKPRTALFGALALTILTIAAAWGFQLIGGYMPCPLCYRQRWPYYAAIVLGLALMPIARKSEHTAALRFGLFAFAAIMLVSFALGLHHAGVEWGWWPGPDSCAAGPSLGRSGSILPDLSHPQVVSCTEAQWRLFGLSFAGYNALISLLIAAIAAFGALAGSRATPVAHSR